MSTHTDVASGYTLGKGTLEFGKRVGKRFSLMAQKCDVGGSTKGQRGS